MKNKLLYLFDFGGTISAVEYALTGLCAFIAKFSIDRVASGMLRHTPWLPWDYLDPLGTSASLLVLGDSDRRFLLTMALIALPFIWLGVSLTTKRLRSFGAPLALTILFFIPLVNLLFFLLLSFIPSKDIHKRTNQAFPNDPSRTRDAALAIIISAFVCLTAVWCANKLSSYGWGVFVGLPFCIGLISVVVFSWRVRRTWKECQFVAIAACGVAAGALLAVAFEGLICLIMAAPIGLVLALLGATVGYHIQHHNYLLRNPATQLLLLVIYSPVMIGSEARLSATTPEYKVTTSVEVNAPPSRVWLHVITFTPLSEPDEWLFKTGIAYPVRAVIMGHGVGALRYCVFSTGAFVEPITDWNEPRLLEFSVTQNPAPMRELTPYDNIHPRHLQGFLVSSRGQFLLIDLAGGRTRLEGTTWYTHGLWPSSYWRLWSDFIIHRIHLRVLNHVKDLSEKPASQNN
jgi:hypothetical protein